MIIRPSGVVVQNNQLLVMRYQYGTQERFNLPGGNLDPGEEIKTCLAREFAEELDLEIVAGDLLFCAETTAANRHVMHLVFPVVTTAGVPCLNPTQTKAKGLQWLSPETLESAPLYPEMAKVLANWLAGIRTFPTYLGRLHQPWFE